MVGSVVLAVTIAKPEDILIKEVLNIVKIVYMGNTMI